METIQKLKQALWEITEANERDEKNQALSITFTERFETNNTGSALVMSSTGCFARHKTPRSEQFLTQKESQRAEFNNIYNKADFAERRLLNQISLLKEHGIKYDGAKWRTLEDFVQAHIPELERFTKE
jgi:hypothetical protein